MARAGHVTRSLRSAGSQLDTRSLAWLKVVVIPYQRCYETHIASLVSAHSTVLQISLRISCCSVPITVCRPDSPAMANETALYVILALLAAWFIATLFFVVFVIGMLLTFRPWDGSVQRNYSWTANCPYAAFWLGTWISNVAGYVQALKPAPLRATELAISYVQSHVSSGDQQCVTHCNRFPRLQSPVHHV